MTSHSTIAPIERRRSYLGVGFYSIPEAARLMEVPTSTLRRWVHGYLFAHGRSNPLFQREMTGVSSPPILTFQDLIELFMVRQFRRAGCSLQRIREEERQATTRFHIDHPFAARRALTDEKYWCTEAAPSMEPDGSVQRVVQPLPSRQLVFTEFLQPFLKNLEYEGDEVSGYWPLGRDQRILIDRSRAFGKPIDHETGIPTRALYDLHAAGDSIEEVAHWYHVAPEVVRAAVAYEKQLQKA